MAMPNSCYVCLLQGISKKNIPIFVASIPMSHYWLVVWNIFISPYIWNIIIPTDELHHFSEGVFYHQPDYIINHH